MDELSTTRFVAHRVLLVALLGVPLILSGCKESPRWTKAGPLFSGVEKASSAKAVVYVYWPWEERGGRKQLYISPCDSSEVNELLPGGYTSFVVEPGPRCFKAEVSWEVFHNSNVDAFTTQDLGKVEIQSEPGHSSFIRLERKRGLLSHFALRRMEPGVAEPEIRRCRQSIPL